MHLQESHAFVRFSENLFFGYRRLYIVLCLLLTVFFGWKATQLRLDASFEKTMPTEHPFLVNYSAYKGDLSLPNDLRIVVETTEGDIFTPEYLEALRKVNDEAMFLDGVDKARMESLWTANTRWTDFVVESEEELKRRNPYAVWDRATATGLTGGEVISSDYDGSPEQVAEVKENVLKSDVVGRLVANNFKSTMIYLPLLELDPAQGVNHDYLKIGRHFEDAIRSKMENDKIRIHVVGFGKKMHDMLEGAIEVAMFFFLAVGLTFVLMWLDTRCLRSSIMIIVCSLVAVVWQMGILVLLGQGMDTYSMLIPFLVFAMAVSHSVQITTSFAAAKTAGHDDLMSARLVFRSLFAPGAAALGADAIGFFTLYLIQIRTIQDLAIAAGIGTIIVTFTNLILVKLLFSYFGISQRRIEMTRTSLNEHPAIWVWLSKMASPKVAVISTIIAAILGVGAWQESRQLKIGDLDPGAPELRPDSRYNQDFAYISNNYSLSPDILIIMVQTPPDSCTNYAALEAVDRLTWQMEEVEGVQAVFSLLNTAKRLTTSYNDGNLRWNELPKSQSTLNDVLQDVPTSMINMACNLLPVYVYLDNHRDETLMRATAAVQQFARDNDNPEVAVFKLGAGSASFEAATNETIKAGMTKMLWLLYGTVILTCWITFSYSIIATVCCIIPLVLTSMLCEAIMAFLGMGVKIGTLPVIALGVGIGVDYGIYIYSKMQEYLDQGMGVQEAYLETLCTTGKAVAFTGLTLAVGVGTWIFSAIKFQADMGLLLTFMFLWNMIGAMWLLPAIAELMFRAKARLSGQPSA